MPGAIDHRDAEQLHELTDGWVAGLQLLAVDWIKNRQSTHPKAPSPGAFARVRVQDDRAFAAYFQREVLSRLSPAELGLLIGAAACERFCAPLCAVLTEQPAAVAEVAAMLTRLENDNLFIVAIEPAERECAGAAGPRRRPHNQRSIAASCLANGR